MAEISNILKVLCPQTQLPEKGEAYSTLQTPQMYHALAVAVLTLGALKLKM